MQGEGGCCCCSRDNGARGEKVKGRSTVPCIRMIWGWWTKSVFCAAATAGVGEVLYNDALNVENTTG